MSKFHDGALGNVAGMESTMQSLMKTLANVKEIDQMWLAAAELQLMLGYSALKNAIVQGAPRAEDDPQLPLFSYGGITPIPQ